MKKQGQEEIVGFAIIIVIVYVILLVFLSFFLRSSRTMEIQSSEVEGFIQAFLQQTSDCEDALGFLSVQKLMFSCDNGEICFDERSACDVLDSTMQEISENSWNVGEDTFIRGYKLRMISEDEEIFMLEKGNITRNYKGALQPFSKRGKDYEVSFNLYYD